MPTENRGSQWQSARSAGLRGAAFAVATYFALGVAQLPGAEVEIPKEILSIDPPAAPGSTFSALAVEGPTTVIKEHQILLTWLEPRESGNRLRFARFSGQAWTEPITVAEMVSIPDRADQPALAVIDTQAVRRTLIARTGAIVARSGDGGRTWTRLPAAVLPFASFAGGDEGGYVFWLEAAANESAKLLGSRILAGEILLDPLAAAGSSTASAMTWDGPIVIYRDRDEESAHGIGIVRRENARWTKPRRVYDERWRPESAPSSAGLRVAVLRRQVVVAWYTEAEGRPRILAAFSSDAGRTFGAPLEVAAKERYRAPTGSADVALDDAGHASVLWRTVDVRGRATVHLARISPDDGRGEELVLAEGPADRIGEVVQIAGANNHVAAHWIEGESPRVSLVPLAAIPSAGEEGISSGPASLGGREVHKGRGRLGDSVPNIELTSLDGEMVSTESLEGQAVLLNLWATWCIPCLSEMPELAALHDRYSPEGLKVVGASVDDADAIDKVERFVAERGIPFDIWLDPEMRLYSALRAQNLPVTLVIGADGRIVFRRDRAISAGDLKLDEALRQALRDRSQR